MSDFSFGAFQDGSSLMHRLDPRCKILGTLCFFAAALLVQGALGLGLLAITTLATLLASKTSPHDALRSIRPFWALIVFVAAFDLLFVKGGAGLFRLGSAEIDSAGLAFAADSVLRFTCMLLATSTLMRTTSPDRLTDGFSLLLSPLDKLGVKTDDLALSLGMTFRFIPSFSEDLHQIKLAQESRGARFSLSDQGLLGAVKAWIPLVIALFSSAFRRSKTLALALANREYGFHGKRSLFFSYHWSRNDSLALFVMLAFLCITTLTRLS